MAAMTLRMGDLIQHVQGHADVTDIRRRLLLYFRKRNGGPKEGLLEINRIKLGDGSLLCITITVKWTAELRALIEQFVCVRETVNGLSREYVYMELDNIELRRFKEVREELVQGGYVYDGGTVAVPDVRYKDLDNGNVYQYTTVGLDINMVTVLHNRLLMMYCGNLPQLFPGRVVKYCGSFHAVVATTREKLILHVLEEGVEFQAINLRQVRMEEVEELGEMALDQQQREEVLKLMKGLTADTLDPQYAQPIQVSE
ncbi:uncharacterized protein LOC106179745 [Lingula anatina]|uniref:Uncharacterized protein LOC106179745 n=1 Tax=Lingula anatina TaxID=7574 RepID=A0A1S3K8G8_LINAN|nr:uncharacterized protein LOC106179745 [Lingula anatina]|eukprot:XP_013418930.1 uncharacterized protein LOC106179745 [Lingula anatina]